MQSLGSTGVTIKVEMQTPEAITVELTDAAGAITKQQVTDARRFQSVRVDKLQPGTAYRYRVLAGANGAASDEGHFTTAPADNKPFKLIVYGDSRSDAAAHAAVVRSILGVPSDFLVGTGDMVAEGDEENDWKDFFDVENGLLRDRCLFASIGNHELLGDKGVGASTFLRYFAPSDADGKDRPKLYGTFRWSNTRFFMLNAMDDWSGEEKDWLKSELDRALNEPGLVHRFAVLHHGPFSSGPHGGNDRLIKNGVLQIFRDGKVDLILAGHDHAYERGTGEGLKYILSGGSGAPLYPRKTRGAETAVFESVHHFVEMSVDGDKVAITVHRASGSILEKCGFAGSGPWDCDTKPPEAPKTAPGSAETQVQKSSACGCSVPGGRGSSETGALAIAAGLAIAARSARRRRTARGRGARS